MLPSFSLLYSFNPRGGRTSRRTASLQKPVRLYFAVISLWLLTGIALPVLYLYQTAHCAEYTTWSKYLSLKVASDNYQRKRKLTQTLNVFDSASVLEERGDYLGLWPDIIRINKGIFDSGSLEQERMEGSPLDSVEFLTCSAFHGPNSFDKSCVR